MQNRQVAVAARPAKGKLLRRVNIDKSLASKGQHGAHHIDMSTCACQPEPYLWPSPIARVHIHRPVTCQSKQFQHDAQVPALTSCCEAPLNPGLPLNLSVTAQRKKVTRDTQVTIAACPPKGSFRSMTVWRMCVHFPGSTETEELSNHSRVSVAASTTICIFLAGVDINCLITSQRQQLLHDTNVPVGTRPPEPVLALGMHIDLAGPRQCQETLHNTYMAVLARTAKAVLMQSVHVHLAFSLELQQQEHNRKVTVLTSSTERGLRRIPVPCMNIH